ncbi:MAG: cytidylate kinase family protein [Candidatus Zixiibacteriota bacterium]
MPVVSIFSGTYCLDEEVTAGVARNLDHRLIADEEVIAQAAGHCDLPEEKLRQAMHGQLSIFSRFTREKERAVAYLREAIAELALADNVVHRGFAGHLLPGYISHVLKVCLVAGQEFRIARAAGDAGQAKGKVKRRIQQEDLARSQWTAFLFQRGPWDRRLYDIKIPCTRPRWSMPSI